MKQPFSLARVITGALVYACSLLTGLSGAPAQAAQDTMKQFQYDPNGNRTQVTDPRGLDTDFSYDALNRLKQQLSPPATAGEARTATTVNSDGLNQVTGVLDPRNLNTNYSVDGLGNAWALSSPDTGVASATYDAAGNLKTRTDARGKTSTYTYDALNRVTKIAYSAGAASRFEYDDGPNAKGRLTKIVYEGGSTAFAYDAQGRLISQIQTLGTAAPLTTAYAYGDSGSALGKLIELTYPSGNQLVFTYDTMGRVSSIWLRSTNSDGLGTNPTATKLLTDITYNAFGRPTDWAWGNSTGAVPNRYARTYDLDGRITSYPLGRVAGNGVLRSLAYDAAGRITSAMHTGSGTGAFAPAQFNQVYGYDDLNRLTGFYSSASNQTYRYDSNGNRTQTTIGASSFTHAIAADSNRLLASTGSQLSTSNDYDAAGNLLSNGTVSFAYSDRGRLKTATMGSNVVTYVINALGQRVKKSGPRALVNRGINQYVYDEQGRLLGEYDGDGRALQETVYLGSTPVAVLKQTTTPNLAAAVVVDNSNLFNVSSVGSWPASTSPLGFLGVDYQSHPAAGFGDSFTWNLNLSATGRYRLESRWASGGDRTTGAKYTAASREGAFTATANQQLNNGIWVTLAGDKTFDVGVVPVTLRPAGVGLVVADAVRATPLVVTTNVYYVYPDHLNTPRVITRSADNKMVWRWDFADPFGVAAPNENPQSLGAFTYNPRFPGQLFDKETRLHHNYFRDYDPQTGRYIQSDPLGLAGGLNTYAYANLDPVGSSDPFGLRPLDAREKRCLAPYIPQVDLDNAELHEDKVPWYLLPGFAGIARGNDIYFRPGHYDGSTAQGIASLAHELVHVRQYREGKNLLSFAIAGIAGHAHSELEDEARDLQKRVFADLGPTGNADCECRATDEGQAQVENQEAIAELLEVKRALLERIKELDKQLQSE